MEQRFSKQRFDAIEIMDAAAVHEDAIRAHSDDTHATHTAALPHAFGPDNGYQHTLLDAAFDPTKAQRDGFRSLVRVACREGDLLGYVLVIWNLPDGGTTPSTTALVADIGTLPAGRGQGIGARLLADIKSQMVARGWDNLLADVWQDNAASHRLFGEAGFDAERTEYRFGTPPVRLETETDLPRRRRVWMFLLLFFGGCALLATMGR